VPEESWAWDPRGEPDGELFGVTPDDLRPYPVRWSRPGAQLAARVALWGAVAFGCLSGLIAIARAPAAAPPAPASDATDALPAPVAGTAERAVAAWLTAAGDDRQDVLASLFVEPVDGLRDAEPLDIGDVTTVAGSAVGPGYWWVTVAVDVTETPASEATAGGGDEGDAPAADPVTTTWYVQVAVVGDVEAGLAVLTTPTVVPVAPVAPGDWRRVEGSPIERGTGPYDTIEGFLRALLVGDGEPTRYMTPGWSIDVPAEPMFVGLEIEEMTSEADTGDDPLRVRVDAAVDTIGGTRRDVAYTVEVHERDGRWEVVDLPGGPSVNYRDSEADSEPAATTSSFPPTTAGDGSTGPGTSLPTGGTSVPWEGPVAAGD
jgi:hypothetical protein